MNRARLKKMAEAKEAAQKQKCTEARVQLEPLITLRLPPRGNYKKLQNGPIQKEKWPKNLEISNFSCWSVQFLKVHDEFILARNGNQTIQNKSKEVKKEPIVRLVNTIKSEPA